MIDKLPDGSRYRKRVHRLPLPEGVASVRFFMDGKEVGSAVPEKFSEEIMYEPIEILGNHAVVDHIPAGYRIKMQADIFRAIQLPAEDIK